MPAPILVTGATGTVGAEVVSLLREKGRPFTAAVRDAEKAKMTLGADVACVRFDFKEPGTYGAAFDGVRKLFLVRPPALSNVRRDIAPALRAAQAAGIKEVVFLSIQGAERNPFLPHRQIEKRIEAAGLTHTFLRPSFFMQNLSTTHRAALQARAELFVPAGRGRTSFIDARDVAAVAARALVQKGHGNAAYELTGPEALSYYEVADVFTEVLGRPITYASPSLLAYALRMYRQGHPLGFVLVTTGIYAVVRFGGAARVTPEVERLLGRPATPLRTFVADYRGAWA